MCVYSRLNMFIIQYMSCLLWVSCACSYDSSHMTLKIQIQSMFSLLEKHWWIWSFWLHMSRWFSYRKFAFIHVRSTTCRLEYGDFETDSSCPFQLWFSLWLKISVWKLQDKNPKHSQKSVKQYVIFIRSTYIRHVSRYVWTEASTVTECHKPPLGYLPCQLVVWSNNERTDQHFSNHVRTCHQRDASPKH
jgi:hypothetical protein